MWDQLGSINVTTTSLPFFQQFSSGITTGTFASTSETYTTLTTAVKNFADGFIAVNAQFTPSNGDLAEQYSRSNGQPVSAVDLTWSYAATLTAFHARTGKTYPGWGAAGLTVPAVCSTSGSGSSGGGGGAGTVAVTFNVQATTFFGGECPDYTWSRIGTDSDPYLQRTSTSLAPSMPSRTGPPTMPSSSHPRTTPSGAVCCALLFVVLAMADILFPQSP